MGDRLKDEVLDRLIGPLRGAAVYEFGLSVLVGGSWVAGVAISGERWYGMVRSQLAEALEVPSDEPAAPTATQEEADALLDGFLHLRDARVWQGGDGLPGDGGLVRVRVEDISAWTFGTVRPFGEYASPPTDFNAEQLKRWHRIHPKT